MYEKASATAPQAHTTIKSTSVIPTSPSTQKPDTNITTPEDTKRYAPALIKAYGNWRYTKKTGSATVEMSLTCNNGFHLYYF